MKRLRIAWIGALALVAATAFAQVSGLPWQHLLDGPAPASPTWLMFGPHVSAQRNADQTVDINFFGVYRGPEGKMQVRYIERLPVDATHWWLKKVEPVTDWEDVSPVADGSEEAGGATVPDLPQSDAYTIQWRILDKDGKILLTRQASNGFSMMPR